MKRYGNLYNKIISIENLKLADKKARKGKLKQFGVIKHLQNEENNILTLHNILKSNSFNTSNYKIFIIKDPKEREIFKLPYYPDRIVHHAIMNILEPIFIKTFTKDTYSCIKNRGIHKALFNLKLALKDIENTKYCLKLDIKKFYPNIDHGILKSLLRRKFKDKQLLKLLDNIIDSASGVPIGNYLSQFFANFYLTYFDHWLKEIKKVKYYFRYCDDIVILNSNKIELHKLLINIKSYLSSKLKLEIKNNYQIFPINSRGLDFVGYKTYHTHTLIRKSIKNNFIRMINKNNNGKSKASYYGWFCHANTYNLRKKYLLKL